MNFIRAFFLRHDRQVIDQSIAEILDSTMIIKYRFLDPVLARKYDFDGFARALFTFVGFDDSPHNGPRTITLQRSVMEELRKVVLNRMTSDCTHKYERDNIMPKIVAKASFYGQMETGITVGSNFSDSIDSRLDNAIELETYEDVRRLLQGFYQGADLKIWIDASPLGHLPSPTTKTPPSPSPFPSRFEKENRNPNKRRGSRSSSTRKRAVSDSLKAIAKAGSIKIRSPRKSAPTNQSMELGINANDSNEKNSSSVDHAPTPLFPTFSEFCGDLDASTRSTSTTSVASTTSISSILSDEILPDEQDQGSLAEDDSNDDEIRKMLALAGCQGYDTFDGLCSTCEHQDVGLLSGLSIADTSDKETRLYQCVDCNTILQVHNAHRCNPAGYDNNHIVLLRDKGVYQCLACDTVLPTNSIHHYTVCPQGFKHFVRVGGTDAIEKHLTPSFFETKTSLSSVSTFGEGNPIGHESSILSFKNREGAPFVQNHSTASSQSFAGSILCTFPCSTKDTLFCESSSLMEGKEREMAGILDSVLDSVFLSKERIGQTAKVDENDLDATYTGVGQPKSFDVTGPSIPCPTPKELLQIALMD